MSIWPFEILSLILTKLFLVHMVNITLIVNIQTIICNQWRIQAVWETGILVLVSKLWCPKNAFQVFFFQLYFNKNHIDVMINIFKKHLEDKNADRREKQWFWSKRRNYLQKCFHSFKYVINNTNVSFSSSWIV